MTSLIGLDFANMVAYRYETHNKAVLKYFTNRPNDLLILNLAAFDNTESGNKQIWNTIAHFLGCQNMTAVNTNVFSVTNAAPKNQSNVLPSNVTLNWREYFGNKTPHIGICNYGRKRYYQYIRFKDDTFTAENPKWTLFHNLSFTPPFS